MVLYKDKLTGVTLMNRFFNKVLGKSTLYYTIIVAVFNIAVLITNSSDETIFVNPSRILWFLPFSICFAVANTVLQYKNIEAITRWGIHFVLTVVSAFLFIVLPADLNTDSGKFMGFIFISAIYIVGVLFTAILTSRIKKTINQDIQLKSKSNTTRK